ncbi:uncharacterized protein BXZ73DRAFT_43946 [Epithele typhae]|uniref:uncharacterized protein n=1 Tax=Epithele typhae TaxID=378194 RepID=UPI002008E987|nr:uncharacterized protein BXZ73DRAFT_43946 [Epithele typhae]KAH9939298.1 hypothetical protein BXZ73DRAFT_43946 [Epithele typhae]
MLFLSSVSLVLVSLPVLLGAAVGAASPACAPLPTPLSQPSDLPIISHLPDPFSFRLSDSRVEDRADWECRRAELKTLVQEYLWGYLPDHAQEVVHTSRTGSNITVTVSVADRSATFVANITFPPTPEDDDNELDSTSDRHVPVVISAGTYLAPVNITPFLESGVAVVQFDVNDVGNDSWTRVGEFWELYPDRNIGLMGVWAWAEHRILDALELVVPELDFSRVGVVGCSRYGKTALAAAIFDERITLALPLSSGAEGIGPWRYYYESQGVAEKIENITTKYGYWSTTELWKFDNVTGNSTRVPFDAHELVSLVAPRAILWDEGQEDWWTNPEGSVSVVFGAAKVVFDALGVGDRVGVHVRHPPDDLHCGLAAYSLVQPFLQKTFFGTPTTVSFDDISPFPPHPEAYPWSTDVPQL